jgi:hypothetical protein
MSETTSETPTKSARPLNRWSIGTLSVLQIVFLAIFLIALNYLSANFFTRRDMSPDAAYTLSPATRSYLAGKDVTSRVKPIKWIIAFRRSSPFYEQVKALAEEYKKLSGGKIQLELVDPMRSADRAQEIIATYGISFVKDMIIMDARTDDSPVLTEDKTGIKTLNPHVKIAVADDMAVYSTENEVRPTRDSKGENSVATQKVRKITAFQGEDSLTAHLVESIEGKPRKMVFLADKSRIDSEGENSPWKNLETTLRFQNVQLSAINLSGLKEIPADTEGVALIAPKYDLTDEETHVLETYFNRPKAAMLIMLKPGDTPPKLRTFLRSYGVTPRRDRIIAMDGERITTTARGSFTYGVDFIKALQGQAAVFEGASSSLEVREGAEDLMLHKINPIGLVVASPEFWGETKFGEGHETYDEKEDTKGPLYLAACVTRGAANDDSLAEETSRMVIISNTDFLDASRQRAENMDFLASSVNWLMNRTSLAGIGPRSIGTYKLPILEAQVSFINRVNLFFLPSFLIVIGAFIWSSRRA